MDSISSLPRELVPRMNTHVLTPILQNIANQKRSLKDAQLAFFCTLILAGDFSIHNEYTSVTESQASSCFTLVA